MTRPVGDACRIVAPRQARDERLEPLEALFVEAPKLGDGLGVVVDAKVERGVALRRVDDERRRLLAALVAAGGLAGRHRVEEAQRERLRADALRTPPPLSSSTRGPGEHVAGERVAASGAMAAPVDARAARVRGDASGVVDHVQLPVVAARVRGGQRAHDVRGIVAARHGLERGRRVERIDERLGRERADAACRVRAQRADGKEPARDGDAEGSARIARDDGPGHRDPQ